MSSLIENLNAPQRDAVVTMEGPVLILAGAGSGKTKALTHRFANLIFSGSAAPQEVLAVTFTNKAAKEMGHRISNLLGIPTGYGAGALWISTFHSFCVRVLRKHATRIGYRDGFVIYDDSDQLQTIKKCMNALNINDKIFPAKMFKSRLHQAKMKGLDSKKAAKTPGFAHDQRTLDVFERYELELKNSNAFDFEDLLLKTYELLAKNPDVLADYQQHFKYIMVDEYQDTNYVQYLLIQLLAKAHRNLCVVGDEDQSIYSWRGADISNILNFEKDFPDAKVIKLEENYRSTGCIVKAASAVIRLNSERKDKTLFTQNPDGDLITLREERSEYEEARWVAKSVQGVLDQGEITADEIAIFYRTNAQSRVLEEQFRTLGLPYQIFGGMRFYDRAEIKDILCYFRLAINPDDDAAFRRVLNVPARGIGKTSLEKLDDLAILEKTSLFKASSEAVEQRAFNSGTTSKLRGFLSLIQGAREQTDQLSLMELYQWILEKTDYLARLKAEATLEAESRIENLRELGNALDQFTKERPDSSIATFLEEMSLSSDLDKKEAEQKTVTMMTLHLSKGLEYPYVYIVGLEENLFPSNRFDQSEQDEQSVEEERRLAYVGMTRARQKLHLTYARTRKVWGQDQFNPPSRFIAEIPKEYIQMTSALQAGSFSERLSQSVDRDSFRRPRLAASSDSQEFPDYEGEDQSERAAFQKGQRVRHPTFGVGTIYLLEGKGDMEKVSVLFQDKSLRKFVTKYARLELF